jgi:hypothetical protein
MYKKIIFGLLLTALLLTGFFYLLFDKIYSDTGPKPIRKIENITGIEMKTIGTKSFYKDKEWTVWHEPDEGGRETHICVNIYASKAQRDTMDKLKQLLSLCFPKKEAGEICNAVIEACTAAKKDQFDEGKIVYRHGQSGKTPYVDVSNWRDYGGTVYVHIKLPNSEEGSYDT